MYSIKCLTIWYKKWLENNWKTSSGDVKNKDIIEKVIALYPDISVTFTHYRSHQTEPKNGIQYVYWFYNNKADNLASKGVWKN